MTTKTKVHLPTALTAYFLAGALLALASVAMRKMSLVAALDAMRTDVVVLLVVGVVLAAVGLYLHHRYQGVRWSLSRLVKVWHLILAWPGAGLATFGISQLVNWRAATPSVGSLALAGPLACLVVASPALVGLVFVVWTLAIEEAIRLSKIAHHKGGKGSVVAVARNTRKAALKGVEYASGEKPEDGHFVEVTSQISPYVIEKKDVSYRIPLGRARLAPKWGQRRTPVELGLPEEGSGLLIGAPGSGKGLLLLRILLNLVKPDPKNSDALHTRVIVLSTKPRDLAGPSVAWLRSQGFDVGMWDLTEKTAGTNEYGRQERWSPVSLCVDADASQRTAARLVKSGQDPDANTRDDFWHVQVVGLLSPCLRAAQIAGLSYREALGWVKLWSDPEFNRVDIILFGAGEIELLRLWTDTRKMLLEKVKIAEAGAIFNHDGDEMPQPTDPQLAFEWAERKNLGAVGGTGMSINATLNNVVQHLGSETAYRVTSDPTLVPRDWVRAQGSAALFLVGNTQEKGVTRSLLATCLHETLTNAVEFAREFATERLPYRLIVLGDELANLAPIPDLEEFFSTARSHRIQLLAVVQSKGQLENVYGREIARVLFDASVATVILSGISDPELIDTLSRIGGSKRVELNDGQVTTAPLIQGHDITALRPPDATTGASGVALLLMSGGIAKIEVPLWTLEEPFKDRGTVMPQYVETTERLRRQAHPYRTAWEGARTKAHAAWAARRSAPSQPTASLALSPGPATATPSTQTSPSGPPGPAPVVRPLTARGGTLS